MSKTTYLGLEKPAESEFYRIQHFNDNADIIDKKVHELENKVGSPFIAQTAAQMTDKTRVYVYVGSESGYTKGNWYYHNGSKWISGGVYNSQGVDTDKNLDVEGKAADAKATGDRLSSITEDLVATQKAYLVNPKITNNLYVNAEGTIIGYDGWDLADIPVLGGDKIIIYSPTDSKYNAMYFANYANFKNVELKNGLNYIDIPDGYRSLVVSNEREIMKKVRFLVFPMQVINSNNEKLKKADKGKVLFNKVPYTYINNVDGN